MVTKQLPLVMVKQTNQNNKQVCMSK